MKMKLYKNICYIFLIFSFISCEDYLEIDTKGTSSDTEIFSDIQGFEDAIRGVYTNLKNDELYGRNLSYGMLDNMAQYFYRGQGGYTEITEELIYDNPDFKSQIETIWGQMYFSIAASNNILKFADETTLPNFHNKNYIVAEAKFLRAFLHFDIMRLYVGDYEINKNNLAIPYSTEFSKLKPKYINTQEVVNAILKDLDEAEALFEGTDETIEKYFSKESIHVNVHTVWALKARIFNYINNSEKAILYAEKIINSSNYSICKKQDFKYLHRGFIAQKNITSSSNVTFNECIFGLYNKDQAQSVKEEFNPRYNPKMVRQDYPDVFNLLNVSVTNSDVRYDHYFTMVTMGARFKKLSPFLDDNDNEGRLPGINLIRLPEIHYILANCYYNKDKTKALEHLNFTMFNRGLQGVTINDINNKDNFNKILVNEIQKEYWGEGQLFFAHKTYKVPMIKSSKEEIIVNDANFTLPIPNTEIY